MVNTSVGRIITSLLCIVVIGFLVKLFHIAESL